MLSILCRGEKSFSVVGLENLFQGHTSWQSSHPKILLPIAFLNCSGIAPRDSIVRYEIHLVASNIFGPTKALVGQASMQAEQLPQLLVVGSSIGSGISVNSSPRKNQDPALLLISMVFFPIHPMPAFSARARSRIGALSVKAR